MAAAEQAAAGSAPSVGRPGLVALRRRVRPVALADERLLNVPGPLGEALPHGGVQRGSVVAVEGRLGAGVTSVVLTLAAAATAAGEWAGVVEPGAPTLGVAAAHEAGVALERLVVVRDVPGAKWAPVLAALVEGMALVVAVPPPGGVRPADARRLLPRLRERGAVVVAVGPWPDRAAVRIHVEGGQWQVEAKGRRWASAR